MKTNNPHGDNAPLDALLQEWQPKPSLPPRFQEQVWRRIERAETAPVPTVTLAEMFANWLKTKLPRPALATAYVAVLLMVGVSAGWAQAEHKTARVKNELGERYLRVLDPYLAPRP